MITTALEQDAIRNIMESDYNNAAPTTSNPIWSWDVVGRSITSKNVGGVVSSLVKKGLAEARGCGSEREVNLTPIGEAAYKAIVQNAERDAAALAARSAVADPQRTGTVHQDGGLTWVERR